MKNLHLLIIVVLIFSIYNPAQAQWTQTGGPYGADVRSIASNGSYMFARTSGGIFRSTDNGTTWTKLSEGLRHSNFNALAFNGTDIFAGAIGGYIEYGGFLYLSTDYGESWIQPDYSPSFSWISTGINEVIVCPNGTGGNNIFIGASGAGVQLSTDNGISWNSVNTGLLGADGRVVNTLAAIPNGTGGSNIFAGVQYDGFSSSGGAFLSTNNGESWNAINTGLPTNPTVTSLLISGNNIFAVAGKIYLSVNNGSNWNESNSGIPTNTAASCLAKNGVNLFAGTLNGHVFISTNNGANWIESDNGIQVTYVNVIFSAGTNLYTGTATSLFLSTNNGTNWSETNTGLTNVYINTIITSPNGSGGLNLFAGTNNGVFISTNNGAGWNRVSNGLTTGVINSLIAVPNGTGGANIFAGTGGRGIFLSTDNGANWNAVNNGINSFSYVQAVSIAQPTMVQAGVRQV